MCPSTRAGQSHGRGCASGKPIVATAFPGVEAIVQDGKTGVVVPVGDPKRLALELIRLLRDPKGWNCWASTHEMMSPAGSHAGR
jgi:glycosyltransferase involved in cell wall biosynthesis